jgi:hypothetical protein
MKRRSSLRISAGGGTRQHSGRSKSRSIARRRFSASTGQTPDQLEHVFDPRGVCFGTRVLDLNPFRYAEQDPIAPGRVVAGLRTSRTLAGGGSVGKAADERSEPHPPRLDLLSLGGRRIHRIALGGLPKER